MVAGPTAKPTTARALFLPPTPAPSVSALHLTFPVPRTAATLHRTTHRAPLRHVR
jgi:hypothetical protein